MAVRDAALTYAILHFASFGDFFGKRYGIGEGLVQRTSETMGFGTRLMIEKSEPNETRRFFTVGGPEASRGLLKVVREIGNP